MNDRAEPESTNGLPAARRFRTWLRRAVLFLLVPYLALVLMFAWLQRSMMYFPTRVAALPTIECGLPSGQVHGIEVPVAERMPSPWRFIMMEQTRKQLCQ